MKKNIRFLFTTVMLTGGFAAAISGCGLVGGSAGSESAVIEETHAEQESEAATEPAKLQGIEFDHEVTIEKAAYLSIDAYKDGYYVIKSRRGSSLQQMLVVPEGKSAPEGISEDIVIVQQPVTSSKIDSITLAELLCQMGNGAADKLSLVSVKKDNIFIDQITQNMDKGITRYAGSAKEPDMDLFKEVNPQVYLCNPGLVKEEAYKKVQELGITPFVSYIHQEQELLGRIEWVKALGIIYGDMQAAEDFYNSQKAQLEGIDRTKAQSRTFAMICLRKKEDKAYVRRADDVISKIGEFAGGVNKIADNDKTGWEEMSIEDFINNYKDTDFIIYLDEHGDKVTNKEELTAISDRLTELKAVESGSFWRTKTDYLQMNRVGDMAAELNRIFAQEDTIDSETTYFVGVK